MTISSKNRVLGGLWGAVVGDALGVPVEFRNRYDVQSDPVRELRGFGTYGQPAGTWSDDSSLMLCTVDSLIAHKFDTDDMGQRFVSWLNGKLWTPWGKVFDVGSATSGALRRIQKGETAENAGGIDETSNGNGSLMRILPVGLRFKDEPTENLLHFAHRCSSITHRHLRSQMACGIYCLLVAQLLSGHSPAIAYAQAIQLADGFYSRPGFSGEKLHFQKVFSPKLSSLLEREISSGGYVVDTLTAAVWCFLTSSSYQETVLKAVNLGGDTDTTAIVAGGLAGVHYGIAQVPDDWCNEMARAKDLKNLFEKFASTSA